MPGQDDQVLRHSLSQAQGRIKAKFEHDASFFLNEPGYEPAREEKLKHCCKRVRLWSRQCANPLLSFKHQATQDTGTQKKERRIHVAVLLNMILDAYELCITHYNDILSHESFPEYFANSLMQKSNGRKNGTDHILATIATILSTTAHPRIRAFANLCGLTTSFNPPEKTTMFLRCIEKMYRVKLRDKTLVDDITSVASVVFHNIGLSLSAAKLVIHELFAEPDPYWSFQYLHAACEELKVSRAWPTNAAADLIDQMTKLSSSTRGIKKVDGDSFLEMLLHAWNTRAELLYNDLDRACDAEEASSSHSLQQTLDKCAMDKQILPLEPFELAAFARLLDDFWLADIPWSDPTIQSEYLAGFTRHLKDIRALFHEYRANSSETAWAWEQWEWESEWDWGGLELQRTSGGASHAQVMETGQLNLSHFSLGDRTVQKVGQFLDKSARRQLKTLVLQDNAISDKGCASIVQAITHAQQDLLCLDLSRNKIHKDGAEALCNALQSPRCKLQTLILAKNRLGDLVGRMLLTALANNITLRTLDMSDNELIKCGPAVSLLLRTHPKLRHFDISWNALRGPHALSIAAGLGENNGLESLNVSYNAFGEDGFVALAQALTRNMALRTLNVAHNSILAIKDVVKVIKCLRTNSSLQVLNLNGNPFGDSTVRALEEFNREILQAMRAKGSHSTLSISLDGCTLTTSTTYLLPQATEDGSDDERPQSS